MVIKTKKSFQLMVLLVITLLINLPIISALEISNVRATNILDNGAVIVWETDEAADGFVYYGVEKNNLMSVGESQPLIDHSFPLSSLISETEYFYKVESGGEEDDNSGNFHTFTTLPPDTTAPDLEVELPESITGRTLEVEGSTEAGVTVNVHVNSALMGSTPAREDGTFKILGVLLEENQENNVIVSAVDRSGNVASIEAVILTDTNAPVIELTDLPEVVTEKSIKIKGTISEESSYEIFVNNKSTDRGDGVEIDESVRLDDGKNKIRIIAVDSSGLDSTLEFEIFADTKEQFIKSQIEKGEEYYEGRANSPISGETKANSKVFLYVFRPLGYDYKPDFSKAQEVITADEEGNFIFEDVNFAKSILDIDLDDLAPKIVPSGLEDVSVFSREQLEQKQRFTYQIYLISEDAQGKTAFSQHTVSVNTCLSGDLEFGVESVLEFQRPYNLNPKLLDDGREEIQAVFDLSYQGSGVKGDASSAAVTGYGYNSVHSTAYYPGSHSTGSQGTGSGGYTPSQTYTSAQNTIDIEQGFRITNVRFDKACTQEMLKGDDRVALGCKIFPSAPSSVTKNNDGTKYYVTWKLNGAKELSKAEEDFWNEFKKRQIVMPLKIIINFQEREGVSKWGQSKVQTSCYDLGYSVDIPIDSADLIPDFLANEGVDALNWSITQLNEVIPVVEKVYKVTAVISFVSLGLLTVARIYRVAISKIEPITSKVESIATGGDDSGSGSGDGSDESKGSCPLPPNQEKLYLEGTIENWCDMIKEYPDYAKSIPKDVAENCEKPEALKAITLEEKCPQTAGAWKLEAGLNIAYQWSWDRAFCRSVPASWTDDESLVNIGTAIVKQQQCAVTGRGVPLIEIENCREYLKSQIVNTDIANINQIGDDEKVGGTCWKGPDTVYHHIDPNTRTNPVSDCREGFIEFEGLCCRDVKGKNILDKDDKKTGEKADGFCDATPETYSPTSKQDFTQYAKDEQQGIFRLTPVRKVLGGLADPTKTLIAYKPPGSDQFIVGKGQTCQDVCNNPRRTQPYVADDNAPGYENGCWDEQNLNGKVTLLRNDKPLGGKVDASSGVDDPNLARGNKFAAGYTKDCFVKRDSTGSVLITGNQPTLQQCVCKGEEKKGVTVGDNNPRNPRVAVPRVKDKDVAESFSYRQDRVFKEFNGLVGTHYPKERYYTGRDVSGAFGANYLLDYFQPEGQEQIPRVDPHNQLIGTFQSLCLSGIYKNLKMLESILSGVRNCLVQAKYTGLQDAGMCKTLFTQHVCGLVYKGISYLNSQCSPLNFDDTEKKGDFGNFAEIASKGLQSIPEALEISINDVKDTYGNAKLNEYFREGSQGVAQSICMAAFGFEFPLVSDDFLTDAALAFPTKSWVFLGPRDRQLATFNPAKQTAVFNYDIGGAIMPGCKIRNWKISLECIGPDGVGKPGVDKSCGGKGCDCINAQGFGAGVEGQKSMLLQSGNTMPSAQMYSIPLESPIRVDSPYRYDHVKVELYLDPSEKGNEDKCFEEGYYDGSKGVFYEPIIDASTIPEASCQASLKTGQYRCSALSSLFGFGGAYMDEPYLSCWNYNTNAWTSCNAQNLFLVNRPGVNSAGVGDQIKVGLHLNLDDKAKCLKRVISPAIPGINEPNRIITLPANNPGQLINTEILGQVTESMFTGVKAFPQLSKSGSNNRCNPNPARVKIGTSETGNYKLKFVPVAGTNDKFTVQVTGANPINYNTPAGVLTKGNGPSAQTEFTISDINKIVFDMDGHQIRNILGNLRNNQEFTADRTSDTCEYRISSQAASGQLLNQQQISVTYQLLEPDQGGSCSTASRPVGSSVGRTSISIPIMLQKDPVGASQETGMGQSFSAGNYDQTLIAANAILSQRGGDFDNALANYYYVAALIKQGERRNNPLAFATQIKQMLKLFFTRQNDQYLGLAYNDELIKTPEFQKIAAYMCKIDSRSEFGNTYQRGNTEYKIPNWCETYGVN